MLGVGLFSADHSGPASDVRLDDVGRHATSVSNHFSAACWGGPNKQGTWKLRVLTITNLSFVLNVTSNAPNVVNAANQNQWVHATVYGFTIGPAWGRTPKLSVNGARVVGAQGTTPGLPDVAPR